MNSDIAQLASLAHSQIPHQHDPELLHDDGSNSNKRKTEDGQQGASKARRSRYVSLACNECKRRKIKCNGQTPCQRCGNMNLECIYAYAQGCCNGFKDSQEYKDMAAHIASLQEQVNGLYDGLNGLRLQLGHSTSVPPVAHMQQQYSQSTSTIDPSLQAQSYGQPSTFPHLGSQEHSPQSRPKSQSNARQSFRGLTSPDFNFGVAKSSLQTMGINAQGGEDVDDMTGAGVEDHQAQEETRPHQILGSLHESKDPLWSVSRAEAQRLCQVYEDETGLMYPVVDVGKVLTYVSKLYPFLEAMHRSGLMQQNMPGADSFEDEDTNILKLVLATALTIEGSGRSELGTRLFERVQPVIDSLLLGNVNIKGIRLLIMTAVYEFQRDNEGTSWRLIGLAARLCIESGLHRRETYDKIPDESERTETMLLFWACYVLDRRWSLGTGMPFALQDADIDGSLPRPGDRSPYLTAMIKYSEIGSRVWRSLVATPSAENGGISPINIEEMEYLDFQVQQWHRALPASLQFEHPYLQTRTEPYIESPAARADLRSKVVIYLRANQMRILIHRSILHSATSITQHREQADKVVDIGKDTIRVLTYLNQATDLYRKQQVLYHAYLTSALAVLFLAISHAPAFYAENVRDEFYLALNLVRGLSKGSFVSRRLWRTIRSLKEVAPQLGLKCDKDLPEPANVMNKRDSTAEIDPSRSAAVAMAGLAGHNVDELALFNQNDINSWSSDAGSAGNPDHMANELTHIFESYGYLGGDMNQNEMMNSTDQNAETIGMVVGEDGLSNVLRELF